MGSFVKLESSKKPNKNRRFRHDSWTPWVGVSKFVLKSDSSVQKNNQGDEKSRRLRERIGLKLPVRVHGRDSVDDEWTEMSRLVDVTPFGARLTLKRPTERGRLVHLTLAMPRQLRCFDHIEDQYRVWSLVCNVKLLEPGAGALVEIGVAFVGKHPPRSFESDPSRRYEIASSKA